MASNVAINFATDAPELRKAIRGLINDFTELEKQAPTTGESFIKSYAKAEKAVKDFATESKKEAEYREAQLNKAFQVAEALRIKNADKEEKARQKREADTKKEAELEEAYKKAQLEKEFQDKERVRIKNATAAEAAAHKEAVSENMRAVAGQVAEERISKAAKESTALRESLEEKYKGKSKATAHAIEHDLKHLEEEKRNIARAMEGITDKELKNEIAAQKKAVDSEIQELKRLQKEKGMNKPLEVHDSGAHHGGGFGQGLGIGVGIEIFEKVSEKAKEANAAMSNLKRGTGLVGEELQKASEQAEGVADKFATSGEEAKETMGRIASYTKETDPEKLKQQTEAVIAYGLAHNKASGMVAKMAATDAGRAKIMAEAELNIAKAEQAAQSPAAEQARIQHQLMETIGSLAATIMNSLGPVFKSITPIIKTLGEMLATVLKPTLAALTPIVLIISGLFQDLAPIIKELVETAFAILTPIIGALGGLLKEMLPPIIAIVKEIVGAFMPVFKALQPVIQKIIGVVIEFARLVLGKEMIPVLKLVADLIKDVFAPVLLSLVPLISELADLIISLIVPYFQTFAAIVKFVIENAIAPLAKWFGGFLKDAIEATVGVVTKVIGAINSIVSAVKGVLGMGGDDAKAAVRVSGEAANDEAKKQQEQGRVAKLQADAKAQADMKRDLLQKLKFGKLNAEEEAKLREIATEEENQAVLQALDNFDKKKQAQGGKAGKTLLEKKKEQYDAEFEQRKAFLQRMVDSDDMSQRMAHNQELLAEVKHQEKLRDLLVNKKGEHGKGYAAAQEKVDKALRDLNKQYVANSLTDEDAKFAELQLLYENSAAGIMASEREKNQYLYEAESRSLAYKLGLVKQGSEEEKKLLDARQKLEIAHAGTIRKLSIEDAKSQTEIDKSKAEYLANQIKDETTRELTLEGIKYNAERELAKDNASKLELIETQHKDKLQAIHKKADDESQKQAEELAGKIISSGDDQFLTQEAGLKKFGMAKLDMLKKMGTDELTHYLQTQIAKLFVKKSTDTAEVVSEAAKQTALTTTEAVGSTTQAAAKLPVITANVAQAGTAGIAAAGETAAALGPIGAFMLPLLITSVINTIFTAANTIRHWNAKGARVGGFIPNQIFSKDGNYTAAEKETQGEWLIPADRYPGFAALAQSPHAMGALAVSQNGELVQEIRSLRHQNAAMHESTIHAYRNSQVAVLNQDRVLLTEQQVETRNQSLKIK